MHRLKRRKIHRLDPEKEGIPVEIQNEILESDRPLWEEWKANPHFSHKWVVLFLKRQKAIPLEILDEIARDRAFIKHYAVVLALSKHRSCPPTHLMRFAEVLRWGDLLACMRLPHIPVSVKTTMRNVVMQRYPFFTLGEKIAVCRKAPQQLIAKLRLQIEEQPMKALLDNPNFTHNDALFICTYPAISQQILSVLAMSVRWTRFKDIRSALMCNPKLPRSHYRGLLQKMDRNEMKALLRDPRVPRYAKILAEKLSST